MKTLPEVDLQLKLLEIEKENIKYKHECKMKELEFERKNSELLHEQILTRGRINRAEELKLIKAKGVKY